MRIRRELGGSCRSTAWRTPRQYVAELIRGAAEFRERSVELREQWAFNFGRSVEVGAQEIARIADERAGNGALGIARQRGALRRRIAVSSRRRLLRWASWFAVANAALLAIIGLRYLWLSRSSLAGRWPGATRCSPMWGT